MATTDTTATLTMTSDPDRNIWSALVNAGCVSSEALSGVESTDAEIGETYALMSNDYAVAGNEILQTDVDAYDGADDSEMGVLNAENNKDNNAIQQGLSTYTSWENRENDQIQTAGQNLSNCFSLVNTVLSSLANLYNNI